MEKYRVGLHCGNGCIGMLGPGAYKHKFGGSSWRVHTTPSAIDRPLVLVTLDVDDPCVSRFRKPGQKEIPLCSYINSDAWVNRQDYEIDYRNHTILEVRSKQATEALPPGLALPNPLPEKPLHLRPMTAAEIPTDDASYWSACDTFVGGSSFIRIAGPPLWLQDPVVPKCFCGNPCDYIGAIGYENPEEFEGFVSGRPFFFGEGALYFFVCKNSMHLIVLSQST